jgi:hypothetical protein
MLTLRAQIYQVHKRLTKAQERAERHLTNFRQSLKAEIGGTGGGWSSAFRMRGSGGTYPFTNVQNADEDLVASYH